MRLGVKGSEEEELLFALLGVGAWREGDALLAGESARNLLEDPKVFGAALPNAEDPLAETRRLARKLASALGVGEIAF